MLKFAIPLVLFIILTAFFAIGLNLDPKLVPSPLIGKPVPEFSLPTLKNPDMTVTQKMLTGEFKLVNVWASWCVSCRQEHPFLLQLSKNSVIPIIGLNYKDERKDALQWLSHGDPYQFSAYDRDGTVAINWGVYGTPESFLIDNKGIIRQKHVGPLSRSIWEKKFVPIIREGSKQ